METQEQKRTWLWPSFAMAFLAALLICGTLYFSFKGQTKIKLSGFSPDTEISYKILDGNNNVLDYINDKIDSSGNLVLLPPTQTTDQDEVLVYNLDIKKPADEYAENAKSLNMVLKLKPENEEISFLGEGLSEYSDITIKRGNNSKSTRADWAGKFSEDFKGFDLSKDKGNPIELAFKGFNFADDASLGETPKIEVYYDNIGDVFSYMYPFGTNSGSSQGQRNQWAGALFAMTLEFSAVMVLQTEIIGSFFDAEMQMLVQRKHQELRARAHKDYHPSEQMCRIGTFMRSVAHTERKGETTKAILNRTLLDEYLGVQNSSAESGPQTAVVARIDNFRRKYCDPRDNTRKLDVFCIVDSTLTPDQQRQARARHNKDIDYARTLDSKLTLEIDYSDVATTTEDEEDVLALAKNLYSPDVFVTPSVPSMEKDLRAQYRSRSYAAKQSVAHSTFINIVGMKASAPEGQAGTDPAAFPDLPSQFRFIGPYTNPPALTPHLGNSGTFTPTLTTPANSRSTPPGSPPYFRPYHDPALTEDSGWAYMKALLREFGIDDTDGDGSTDNEIDQILGERPSYYAQMEVLTKKIYQHPNFFTNLYDKPTNVKRIGASIDAIALMHLRDRYESMLRREMIDAVLVEQGLQKHVDSVNAKISAGTGSPPGF